MKPSSRKYSYNHISSLSNNNNNLYGINNNNNDIVLPASSPGLKEDILKLSPNNQTLKILNTNLNLLSSRESSNKNQENQNNYLTSTTHEQFIFDYINELNNKLELNMNNQLALIGYFIEIIKYIDPSNSYITPSMSSQFTAIVQQQQQQNKSKEKKNTCLGLIRSNNNTNNNTTQNITNNSMNTFLEKEKSWIPNFKNIQTELEAMQSELNIKINNIKNKITKNDKVLNKINEITSQISTTANNNNILGVKRSSLPVLMTGNLGLNTKSTPKNTIIQKDKQQHALDDYNLDDAEKMSQSHEFTNRKDGLISTIRKEKPLDNSNKLNIGVIPTTASTHRPGLSDQASYRGEISSRIYKSPQKSEHLDVKEVQIELKSPKEGIATEIFENNSSSQAKQEQESTYLSKEKQNMIMTKKNLFLGSDNNGLKPLNNNNNNNKLSKESEKNNIILGNILSEKQTLTRKHEQQLNQNHKPHNINDINVCIKGRDSSENINAKPYLDTLTKKDILDESFQNNDITENMNDQSSRVSNTNRVFKTIEIDDDDYFCAELPNKLHASKEKQTIKNLINEYKDTNHQGNNIPKYEKKYLICAKWWRSWKEYVNFDGPDQPIEDKIEFSTYPKPGRISNRELINQDAIEDLGNMTSELELKNNLLENHDYVVLNKKVFNCLKRWYDCDYEIVRFLKPDPFYPGKFYLDLYPNYKKNTISNNNNNNSPKVKQKKKVIDKSKVVEILNVNLGKTQKTKYQYA